VEKVVTTSFSQVHGFWNCRAAQFYYFFFLFGADQQETIIMIHFDRLLPHKHLENAMLGRPQKQWLLSFAIGG
jgi:hypothetical protein